MNELAITSAAKALMDAFPTLREDFTDEWFHKVARIALEAAESAYPADL